MIYLQRQWTNYLSQPAHNESIAMQNWKMENNTKSRQVTRTSPSWWYASRSADLHMPDAMDAGEEKVLTEYLCTSKGSKNRIAVRILAKVLYQISDALWICAMPWGGRQNAVHTAFSLWKILAGERLKLFVARLWLEFRESPPPLPFTPNI